jgi:CheY-like chemotaxis protein
MSGSWFATARLSLPPSQAGGRPPEPNAMTNPRPRGIKAFLREAKRRKVYVSIVAYAGVSIGLIELTGAVAEALLFPDWTTRLVTFLLILGFPIILILSWTFDITGRGVVRTSDEEAKGEAGSLAGSKPRARASATPPMSRSNHAPMPSPRRRKLIQGASSEGEGTDSGESAPPPDAERVRKATLAHLRHELRTPINGIIGYAEMLLEDVEDESFTGDLQRILAGGRKLLGLINEVLADDVAGNQERDLEELAKQIEVDLRTPITSVLGYAEMLLETAQEEGQEELVPDLEKIRSAANRLLAASGDIVGLATEGGMAPAIDGSGASDLTRNVLSKIQSKASGSATESEGRLLVVDDNADNRDLLSRQLARQGYIVLTASDGVEALETLEAGPVDLILLDVIMPRMDGVEMLKRLKADEKLHEIPVLMLSSLNEVDGAMRCIEMGAEDYLSKPVRPAILDARIAVTLELHRMRERERFFEERVASDDAFIQELLLSAFPQGVAQRARAGESDLADVVPEATVLSCKLHGLSAPSSSGELRASIQELRDVCLAIEGLADAQGVEVCLWRADGFVAVAGAPSPVEDHLERAMALGQALLAAAPELTGPDGQGLRISLGLHTGPVVAAALGGQRLRYEVWGEGVKTAEEVSQAAPAGALLASPPVYSRLKESLTFEAQKVRDISGVQMRTYLLQ